MRHESGCCGGSGSSQKVKKQKLKQVVAVKKIKVDGMTCNHCKDRVENALNKLPQVNAKVNLKQGEAIVKLGEDMSDEILAEAISQMGYYVESIDKIG